VRADLEKKGVRVSRVILTHYHPDHAGGACVFEEAQVMCSVHYEDNYKNCAFVWDKDQVYRKPDLSLSEGSSIEFGSFKMEFFETPGHSKCSISILINKAILLGGDLIMKDACDQAMLPYICRDGGIAEHIVSLNRLKALSPERMILSHGSALEGKDTIRNHIDLRLSYLEAVLNQDTGSEKLDALKNSKHFHWDDTWHENNIKQFNEFENGGK
ncbi:hypothetical protein ADUPG1_002083, partial [Aduncisulcus paluster]